jgi:hypothetical protein
VFLATYAVAVVGTLVIIFGWLSPLAGLLSH